MKTFIVPTDFSDTSKNAARFAAHLAEQVNDAHIILYNVFDKIETGSDGSVVYNDHAARKTIMELALSSVKTEMNTLAPRVQITCLAEEESSFIDSLERLARHKEADMIIMGITGATPLEQVFGSNTLNMVNRNVCPVMIIPPDASFTGIKNVAFTSDFKDIDKTTPKEALRKVLDIFKPLIHVVNVDSEHYVELTEEYKAERAKLEVILAGFETEYYFMRQYDFVDAINQFVSDYKIDILFIVPKKHSFLGDYLKAAILKNWLTTAMFRWWLFTNKISSFNFQPEYEIPVKSYLYGDLYLCASPQIQPFSSSALPAKPCRPIFISLIK